MLTHLLCASLLVGQNPPTPFQSVLEIAQYRTFELSKAPKLDRATQLSEINAECKRRALSSLKNFSLTTADSLECGAWLTLLMYGERYTDIPATYDKFLLSNPTEEQRATANWQFGQSFLLRGAYAEGMNHIARLDTIPSSDAIVFVALSGSLARAEAVKIGPEAAVAFISDQLKKVEPPNRESEQTAFRSALASQYKDTAEIWFSAGQIERALSALNEALSDPRLHEEELNTLRRLKTRQSLVGSLAPEISTLKQIGDYKDLGSLKGKVVLLQFFANWSTHAIDSFPDMLKLHDSYRNQGLQIVSITRFYGRLGNEYALDESDEYTRLRTFANDHKMTWPTLIADPATTDTYGVTGIPSFYLIDKKGIVRQVLVGYGHGSNGQLRVAVEALVTEPD